MKLKKVQGFMVADLSTGTIYSFILIGINLHRCSDSMYILLLTMNSLYQVLGTRYCPTIILVDGNREKYRRTRLKKKLRSEVVD